MQKLDSVSVYNDKWKHKIETEGLIDKEKLIKTLFEVTLLIEEVKKVGNEIEKLEKIF